MAWHGHFVLLWKGHSRFHALIIPKQLGNARKIFKNLFSLSELLPGCSPFKPLRPVAATANQSSAAPY
jgi:hypothetical protein